jgi:hypothetical protein
VPPLAAATNAVPRKQEIKLHWLLPFTHLAQFIIISIKI